MTTRKITARLLQSKGACDTQVQLFRETFPRGVVPTVELAEQHASAFHWGIIYMSPLDSTKGVKYIGGRGQ